MRDEPLSGPRPPPQALAGRWVIIWDGSCAFCGRWVERALRRERTGALTAVPHQDCLDWLPEPVAALAPRRFHLRSPEGRYWGGGAAAVRVLALLGYGRTARFLESWPASVAVGLAYRWVARNRGWLGRVVP